MGSIEVETIGRARRGRRRWCRVGALFALVVALLLVALRPARADEGGWLLAAQRVGGQYDLVALPASGGEWRALTGTPGDERHPTLSPDGQQLAYAARRERNWDLYLLDLASGRERRLTSDPHYDGFPAFSPDGRRLAFASMRDGDMDIFLLDVATGEATNLTPNSSAQEFEPRWEDDDALVFVSTRDGSQDLFRLDLDTGRATALATTEERDERGAMRVGRRWLAVTRDDRRHFIAPLGGERLLSWGDVVTSAALSPDGATVAWLERRLAGDTLYRAPSAGGEPTRLLGPVEALDDLTWGAAESALLAERLAPPQPLVAPTAAVLRRATLRAVENLDTTGNPNVNSHAYDTFVRLRASVAEEVGFDFLGTVSETQRPIDFLSEDSDPLSWHKSARAVDTLFSLGWRQGVEQMEIVREDRNGDVYWRMWLRCPAQDGSCGEPILDAPWDFFYEARWEYAPGEGGQRGTPPAGYYVDFTRLAEDEGWARIGAHEAPDFDWRQTTTAMEYWHFQFASGLSWYQAMEELYDEETLALYFDPEALIERGTPRWLLRAKGIPLPPALRPAPAEIVVP